MRYSDTCLLLVQTHHYFSHLQSDILNPAKMHVFVHIQTLNSELLIDGTACLPACNYYARNRSYPALHQKSQ
jgi:hypothetical protein